MPLNRAKLHSTWRFHRTWTYPEKLPGGKGQCDPWYERIDTWCLTENRSPEAWRDAFHLLLPTGWKWGHRLWWAGMPVAILCLTCEGLCDSVYHIWGVNHFLSGVDNPPLRLSSVSVVLSSHSKFEVVASSPSPSRVWQTLVLRNVAGLIQQWAAGKNVARLSRSVWAGT